MFSTGAFFASILEPIFFKRKIKIIEIFLGFLVIIGVYIVMNADVNSLLGVFLGISSALLSSLFSVINGKFVQNSSPLVISFYEFFGGIIFLYSYLLIT